MKFDEEFLAEVGMAAMGEEEKKAFLEFVQEELEVRVGEEIADGMSEAEISEFENAATDEEAREWLKKHKPNYREIVEETMRELKEEIRENKGKF